MSITVVGIGAMGGAMARNLLDAPIAKNVVGYDHAAHLVHAFYKDSQAADKALIEPTSLSEAVTNETDTVIVALQNESQCEQVCFGSETNLLQCMKAGSCLILCSTVTAQWAMNAASKFSNKSIYFVDAPMSGGPVRARDGTLTIMASAEEESLTMAKPLLEAMGKDLHIIQGGAGMGSTVKMVHQLLAGVHIGAAAEALALAAKAGLDVEQVYTIVNGAAGASWMFQDRGKRMMTEHPEVKSQLQIFVKDLDIVYSEAKRLQSPIPIASAVLQQFITGQALGLSQSDDSQLVKVYETATGVPVQTSSYKSIVGDQVGDLWEFADGTREEIVEVGNEPRHRVVLANDYVRALRVSFPPNDTTLAHRHAEDSLYFFLVDNLQVVNFVKGSEPGCDCMEFGEVRYGTHKSDKPLVHKITNKSNTAMLCVDAEVLKQPPVTCLTGLVAEKHELIKTRDKCRVYKLTLEPGESVNVTYPFFHLSVILQGGTIRKEIAGPIHWNEVSVTGDIAWKEPLTAMIKTNSGDATFIEFIAEWR
jgi:putative dehydrogenase